MRSSRLIASFFVLAIASSANAQAPHAGMQQRVIKTLSDQQIADLRAGRGMGLALAAELNGYPGPSHVLELAAQLKLSADQRAKATAAFTAMKEETSAIGQDVIAGESELNRLFADHSVSAGSLDKTAARIAALQGRLRAAHLRYHLQVANILTSEQIAAYARLRGY